MIYGSADLGLTPETSNEILALFKDVQPIQQRMLVTVDNFLFFLNDTQVVNYQVQQAQNDLNTLSANRMPYLTRMDNITTALQNRGSTNAVVSEVLAIEYVLSAIAIIAALFQMSIVTRKSYGKIKSVEKDRTSGSHSEPGQTTSDPNGAPMRAATSDHGNRSQVGVTSDHGAKSQVMSAKQTASLVGESE